MDNPVEETYSRVGQIAEMPTTIGGVHESCYKGYHALTYLMEMVNRGDSAKTIDEMYLFFMEHQRDGAVKKD